jgi:hypothetical protein
MTLMLVIHKVEKEKKEQYVIEITYQKTMQKVISIYFLIEV